MGMFGGGLAVEGWVLAFDNCGLTLAHAFLPVTPAKAGAHLRDMQEMGPGLRRGDGEEMG
ncbi:hypothetical protein GCM10011529_18590 [Polymorphobacter glacialis]|uniref:Uncharacterized protein n=1 Tax=Sandarakinorhabdus glacialis TaxID=1614636 RepID=A0A916ZUS8_9SPHN|nr:hypothetical protein GCM10011529_18590 [Polymorphobacter glacialis]